MLKREYEWMFLYWKFMESAISNQYFDLRLPPLYLWNYRKFIFSLNKLWWLCLHVQLWLFNVYSGKWQRLFQTHMGRTGGLVSYGCVQYKQYMVHFGGTGYPFGDHTSNAVSHTINFFFQFFVWGEFYKSKTTHPKVPANVTWIIC